MATDLNGKSAGGTDTVTRDDVRDFYGKAGEKPQAELCCPTIYERVDVSHIPEEVMEVSYGCGSPVSRANLKEGETLVDLGSGGGVDVFIAAKALGKNGKAIGIDMTEEMMNRAIKNAAKVGKNLGYHNVEFRHGYLEEVPVTDNSVDVVTSNCVVNLSPDKKKVFQEINRVLKDGGRFVISDIVSEVPIPEALQKDKKLWGECLTGALTEKEFQDLPLELGFYGNEILSKSLFREVQGFKFWSVTLRSWKGVKGKECVYVGQTATYQGPFSEVKDDEGHVFKRGESLEICTDTAKRLSRAPYSKHFELTGATKETDDAESCCAPEPGQSGCC